MGRKLKTYEGDKVNITWDSALCIHVGECGRANNDLFVGGRDPWCSPNAVTEGEAVDVVDRCTTGALSYALEDGLAAVTAPD